MENKLSITDELKTATDVVGFFALKVYGPPLILSISFIFYLVLIDLPQHILWGGAFILGLFIAYWALRYNKQYKLSLIAGVVIFIWIAYLIAYLGPIIVRLFLLMTFP